MWMLVLLISTVVICQDLVIQRGWVLQRDLWRSQQLLLNGMSSLRSISWCCHQMFPALPLHYGEERVKKKRLNRRHQPLVYFLLRAHLGEILDLGAPLDLAIVKKREKKDAFVGCMWRSLWIGTAFAQRCGVIGPWIGTQLYVCMCEHDWHFSDTPLPGFHPENLPSLVVGWKSSPPAKHVFFVTGARHRPATDWWQCPIGNRFMT